MQNFKPGRISITLDSDWKEPNDTEPLNMEAADRAMAFKLGWFAHPIFVDGKYPQLMVDQVAMKSQQQGFADSRLPEFTAAESARIVGLYCITSFIIFSPKL